MSKKNKPATKSIQEAEVKEEVVEQLKTEPTTEKKERVFHDNEILPFRTHKGHVMKLQYKYIIRKGYEVALDLL